MSYVGLDELVEQFGANRAIAFTASTTLQPLDAALTPQIRIALEQKPSAAAPAIPTRHLAHINRLHGMGICFSTPTALQENVAAVLAARLLDLLGMSATSRNALRTVLHETLINAAVHGNMGLHSPKITDIAAYGALHQAIEAQKSDPVVMTKQITVAFAQQTAGVDFIVCDEGDGFDVAAVTTTLANTGEARANGRGLHLVQAMTNNVTFFDNGSAIQFSIPN